MLNEHAKKWVEALRSGKYKQGSGRLSSEDGCFCALGVACEIAAQEGVILRGYCHYRDPQYTGNDGGIQLHQCLLPETVRKRLGLSTNMGYFETRARTVCHSIVGLNDTDGLNFREIADIIESQPWGLFVEQKQDE